MLGMCLGHCYQLYIIVRKVALTTSVFTTYLIRTQHRTTRPLRGLNPLALQPSEVKFQYTTSRPSFAADIVAKSW